MPLWMVCARVPHVETVNKQKIKGPVIWRKVTKGPAGYVGRQFEIPKSKRACFRPSGNDTDSRRRVWRVVGIEMGLLRYDGEVGCSRKK